MTHQRHIRQHHLSARLLVAFLLSFVMSATFAMSEEALFMHARDAYNKQNEISLAEDVSQLKLNQSVLAPYADYWLMLLRLSQAENNELSRFLVQYSDASFADRVRGEWLKKLAKTQQWETFFSEYPHYQRDDTIVYCYALQGNLALNQDPETFNKIKLLWLTTQDLPSSCSPLFDRAIKTGELTKQDIAARLRLALQDNKVKLAKSIAVKLPNVNAADVVFIDRTAQAPLQTLTKKSYSFQTDYGVELNLFALDRLARTNLEEAISQYQQLQSQFTLDERAFGWSRLALQAARSHHSDALKFYALAGNSIFSDKEQMAWYARAALRVSDWKAVLTAINQMSDTQAQEAVWRYWKARAFQVLNNPTEAQQLLGQLSKERHYYGWLAAEEVDVISGMPLANYRVTELEVSAVASDSTIKRAMLLNQLDMRWDAKAEWAWAIRHFDDQQLLAAAEYAMRNKWYDIAIATADNTKTIHDFNLRYPSPYRDLMRPAAKNEAVDEAWMHGLIRQESRFMHFAKSNVGAAGLMQLMPATAKWAAKRMGKTDYSNTQIHDLSTNIEIGTYYMRHTLDLFNGQAVMATAAYNAGPSRAKKWQASTPLEAAIYMETIPFSETRSYVQKVMANAHMYAPRLGSPIQSLKARLGMIPAKVQTATYIE
jgi:soluble lytic murein transglycosylase